MAPFQNMKLYWKIHIFTCVKEERYDGRWWTLLFQPNGLGLTDISVSMHCSLCAVTAQGYGANHGLQLKGISRLLQLVERLRALRGRCAEHQELAAGVTRGSRELPERRWGEWQCVCMRALEMSRFRHEIQGRLRISGQFLESCTDGFPTGGPSSWSASGEQGEAAGNAHVSSWQFTALRREVALLLPVHISTMFSQPLLWIS